MSPRWRRRRPRRWARCRADKAGVGSAVLNSMRQVGGSLGIAIMGAIVAASATPAGDPADPAGVRRRASTTRSTSRPADRVVGAVVAAADARARPRTRSPSAGRARGAMSDDERDPASACGRGAQAAVLDTACRVFSRCELPRRDDGRDRPRGGDHRADPLPALRARSATSTSRASTRRGSASRVAWDEAVEDEPDPRRLAGRWPTRTWARSRKLRRRRPLDPGADGGRARTR